MLVAVDEAREDGLPFEIYDFCSASSETLDLLVSIDLKEYAVLDHNCLGNGVGGVDGDDLPVVRACSSTRFCARAIAI